LGGLRARGGPSRRPGRAVLHRPAVARPPHCRTAHLALPRPVRPRSEERAAPGRTRRTLAGGPSARFVAAPLRARPGGAPARPRLRAAPERGARRTRALRRVVDGRDAHRAAGTEAAQTVRDLPGADRGGPGGPRPRAAADLGRAPRRAAGDLVGLGQGQGPRETWTRPARRGAPSTGAAVGRPSESHRRG